MYIVEVAMQQIPCIAIYYKFIAIALDNYNYIAIAIINMIRFITD